MVVNALRDVNTCCNQVDLDILKFEGAILFYFNKKNTSLNFVILYFYGLELLLFELLIYPSEC